MIHDPLCPQFCDGKPPKCRGGDCTLCDEVDCMCDLIAKVREDESSNPKRVDLHIIYGYELGRSEAIRDCIAVVEALTTEDYCYDHDCRVQAGTLAALRALLPEVDTPKQELIEHINLEKS